MTSHAPGRSLAITSPTQPPPHMILAEDDDELRATLATIFEADGFAVSCARNGHELVRLLEEAHDAGRWPSIVVTDHRMPGASGMDVAGAVRDNGWPVPIIVITAHARDLDAAAERGADAIFEKPFDADDLRTAVLYCMNERLRETDYQNERE